jgi:ABC-type multidrug transport system permease subunit
MESILVLIILVLLIVSLVGLYNDNDLKKWTTWIYYSCTFSVGLIVGYIISDMLAGIKLGLLNVFVTAYVVSVSRWQLKLGKKLEKWQKKRFKK